MAEDTRATLGLATRSQ
uniref:Uncharacterized protein n=1 Tax=Strigamia maritima TaxID=126957 RepID=T1JM80_STRMM